MGYYRDTIISLAEWWASPGSYKPTAEELVRFCGVVKAGKLPSIEDAQKALDTFDYGVKLDGQVKHWCGIFACYVLRQAGLSVKWDLITGKMSGEGMHSVDGRIGIKTGDVAVINKRTHHFIITDMNYSGGTMRTVEGNTFREKIIVRTDRTIDTKTEDAVVRYYRIDY